MAMQFEFNASDLPTSVPTLDTGIYAGVIFNPAIVGAKSGKQHISIVEEEKWNKQEKKRFKTGYWIIAGTIYFQAKLTSKKAIQVLGVDEPIVIGGQIRLVFDKDTYKLLPNPVLGAWLENLGIKDINYHEMVGYVENPDIEVPEELMAVPNISEMLNYLEYYRQLFNLICEHANGLPCKVHVVKDVNQETQVEQNLIYTGNFNSSCGILPYEDGCEDDLDS